MPQEESLHCVFRDIDENYEEILFRMTEAARRSGVARI